MRELLYRKIAGKIKKDIESGLLSEGARLPGVRELAEEWDTSSNTVLKALDELETAGLIRKRRGQGIFVEQPAAEKSLTADGCSIVFDAFDLESPLNRLLLSGVEKAASEAHCRLSVVTGGTGETVPGASKIIIPERVPRGNGEDSGRPAEIYIGEFIPAHSFAGNYIAVDTYSGFCRAAQLLLGAGRERIAYIGSAGGRHDEPGRSAVRDILTGTARGFNSEWAVDAGGWDAELGRTAMEELLLGGECPDAVLCSNDTLAAGVYKACRAAGMSIPDDVAVIGAGDQDIAVMLDPPLTSLKMPASVMGAMAVGYLRAVESGSIARTERLRARLDMEIILRASVPVGEAEQNRPGNGPADELAWL